MSESFREVRLYLKEVAITLFICYCIFISILLVQNGKSATGIELGVSPSCPQDFVSDEKTKSCYKSLPSEFLFPFAYHACLKENAFLVSIIDEDENNFVASLVKSSSNSETDSEVKREIWLGLVNFENHWKWMYPTPTKYMNWAPGMPDKNPRAAAAKMRIGKRNDWVNVDPSDATMKARVVCKRPMIG